jgi:hypothetical protein
MAKTIGMITLLVVMAGTLEAQSSTVEYKRSFFTLGAAVTLGDSLRSDNLGYGFQANGFQYFDPFHSFGFYYGSFASFFIHSAGGVQIADTRPVVLGWKGELIAPWLGVDASVSPVVGARITGNLIHGSAYVGICPALGFYIRCAPDIDIGLYYQPVINLFNFGGSDAIQNKGYHDIVLSISFTNLAEVKKLGWEKELK